MSHRHPEQRAILHTDTSPFYQAWVLTNLTAKPFTATFGRRFQLNLNDWRVMLTVADRPGTTAQDLAHHTGLDKMIVSRAVRNLEAQGRLMREGSEADRRMRHLFLTQEGWSVYEEIARAAAQRERTLYGTLDAAELQVFQRLLVKLNEQARALGA